MKHGKLKEMAENLTDPEAYLLKKWEHASRVHHQDKAFVFSAQHDAAVGLARHELGHYALGYFEGNDIGRQVAAHLESDGA